MSAYRSFRSGTDRAFALVMAALALAVSIYVLVSTRRPAGPGPAPAPATAPATAPTPAPVAVKGTPMDFSSAAAEVMPSLVKIQNLVLSKHPRVPMFGAPGEVPSAREGTGFFIDRNGLLLTNFHVVDGAEHLKVVTVERREYEAEVVGADALTDIALVRIRPDFEIVPAKLGDSDDIRVGQWVLAMGNPLGLEFFTTGGIVSGFGPPGPGYAGFYDFIQTDANIEPGNSGGPLIDYDGEVVGVNSAYLGPGTGIGFAIPINRVLKILPELKSKGRVTRGFMGLVAQPVTPGLAQRLKLKGFVGAVLSGVAPDGPAGRAGLTEGDVVVAFGGTPVADERAFYELIHSTPPGTDVMLDIVREGAHKSVKVTLAELRPRELITQSVIRQCGLSLQQVDAALAAKLGLSGPGGLLVLKVIPGCPSYEAGLTFGDVVLEVENQKVNSIEDFYRAYQGVQKGGQVLLKVMRGGRPLLLTLEQVG